MSRVYGDKIIEIEKKRTIDVTCDLCGKHAKLIMGKTISWPTELTDGALQILEETNIEFKRIWAFPNLMRMNTQSVDICPSCFLTKLIPWFEAQDVIFSKDTKEWEPTD